MTLTFLERKRLLRGDYRPLIYDERPDLEPGQVLVVSRTREARAHAGDGLSFVPPRRTLLSITVRRVVRRRKGGWEVHFDVTDSRERLRLLRSVPPAYNADLMKRDLTSAPTRDEIVAASEESCYTANRAAAVDHLEAVPDQWLEGEVKKRQEGDNDRRRDTVEEQNRELAAWLRAWGARSGLDTRSELRALQEKNRKRVA